MWTNPEAQPSISNAVERRSFSDPCALTTQPDAHVSVAYTKTGDTIVAPVSVANGGDGRYHRVVTWRASAITGSPSSDLTAQAERALPYHWSNNTAIAGGSLKTPANGNITVGPNVSVALEVNAATDIDTWSIYRGTTGTRPDTTNYKWTSDDGRNASVAFPDGDSSAAARYVAPSVVGTYTLTCTIDDSLSSTGTGSGTGTTAPDDGTRNDNPITRTVTVKVIADSDVELKLYRDAAMNQEASGAVGGKLYPALLIKVGAGQHLLSGKATLRVKEEHAVDDFHTVAANKYDGLVFQLAPPVGWSGGLTGWQKRVGENGSWNDTTEWPTQTNTGSEAVFYRRALPWDSASLPFGHNEIHSIKVIAVDDDPSKTSLVFSDSGGTTNGDAGTLSADVQNLVITDVSTNASNSDYFFFDPDSENQDFLDPKISFTVSDLGDPHQYSYEIKIRSTSSEDYLWTIFLRGTMAEPGTKTVTISSSAQTGQIGIPMYRGTYAFDIEVKEIDDASAVSPQQLDSQALRSPYLSIPMTYNGQPGHLLHGEWVGEEEHAKLDYYLADTKSKDAENLRIELFDPAWDRKLILDDLSKSVNVNHPNNDVYTYPPDMLSGNYKVLITASDGHAASNRDHSSKRMVAVNQTQRKLAIEWIDAGRHRNANVYIIWLKRHYLQKTNQKMRVAEFLPVRSNTITVPPVTRSDADLPTVEQHMVDSLVYHATRNVRSLPPEPTYPGPQGDFYAGFLDFKRGTLWGAINGTFFSNGSPSAGYPITGDIGLNGTWKGGTNLIATPRWAFGFDASSMAAAPMIKSGALWISPSSVRTLNWGLSGTGCLIYGGALVPLNPGQSLTIPSGIMPDKVGSGPFPELLKPLGRSILAWTRDNQHAFLILGQTSANYDGDERLGSDGWTALDAQKFVDTDLKSIRLNGQLVLPANAVIDNAMLLDFGTHAQVSYAWNDRSYRSKDEVMASPNDLAELFIRQRYTIRRANGDITSPGGGFIWPNGRGTRSAVEGFILP